MDNVSIAKKKLLELTSRTEKDLYRLTYGLGDELPLNETTFQLVSGICKNNGITCPLYRCRIEFKIDYSLQHELKLLATTFSIIFSVK
tara:strand:+ start:365 stop:628 length:264 start_codon:yes stop_codon:yes gene_type:complete